MSQDTFTLTHSLAHHEIEYPDVELLVTVDAYTGRGGCDDPSEVSIERVQTDEDVYDDANRLVFPKGTDIPREWYDPDALAEAYYEYSEPDPDR